MKNLKIVTSSTAPKQSDVIWAKQVEGGFALYFREGRSWKPLKVIDTGDPGFTDDKVIAIQEQKPDKFTVIVTTTKTGTDAKSAADMLMDEIVSKLGPEIYNIWSEGPLEFNFTEPDANGKNVTIKGNGLEMKATIGIDDSGASDVATFTGASYPHAPSAYKQSYLTSYFTSLIPQLTAANVEGVLDEGETT